MTLLEALSILAPDSSKSTLRSWLKMERVLVDGRIEKIGTLQLKTGQVVTVGERPKFIEGGIRLLYKDRDIVVIEKPAGLLSVATDFETEETVHQILKNQYRPERVFPVHRLDQDTSGVMLFALNEKARDTLKETFEKHTIERGYRALIEGHLDSQKGTWKSYLYEDANYTVHATTNPKKGKLAITHYEVIEKSKKFSLLDVELETGRKNQIRIHCKEAGHPVVGDKKYGAKTNPIKRLGLHAYLLVLHHPITNKKLRFESPMPREFGHA